jgi:hypothetical protein
MTGQPTPHTSWKESRARHYKDVAPFSSTYPSLPLPRLAADVTAQSSPIALFRHD